MAKPTDQLSGLDYEIPVPKTFDRILETDFDFREIWSYTRLTFFYQKILGYNKNIRISMQRKEPKAMSLISEVERLYDQIINEKLMTAKAVYQFFPAYSKGNSIFIEQSKNNTIELSLPRQQNEPFLCLSDYLSTENDNMGFLVGTAGSEIINYAKEIEIEGQYKDAFILQGIALSTAEALTEMIHHKMRQFWELPEPEWDIKRGPPRKYQGQRYSFGYPACPNMDDQKLIWDLLHPEDIEISLTESFMMQPESSVSCLVFHHPKAKYFNV